MAGNFANQSSNYIYLISCLEWSAIIYRHTYPVETEKIRRKIP